MLTYKMLFFSLILISFLSLTTAQVTKPGLLGQHNKEVVCYVSSWAAYRPDKGKFDIAQLDPHICTHYIYAFAGLNETTGEIRSIDPFRDLNADGGHGWYNKLVELKNRSPSLKVSLAIGGWNEGSANYSKMSADPVLRKSFVASVVKTIVGHGFDGLDLDWEFPGSRGGKPEDKENFVLLVKELKAALAPRNKILTAALGAGRSTIDQAYNIRELGKLLDYLHIMCYDYHGSWDSKTLPNAPLTTSDTNDPLSVMSTIKYLISLGAPREKIIMGIPLYGRTFILTGSGGSVQNYHHASHEIDHNQVAPFGTPTSLTGFQGPFTREDGFLGFNEICLELKSKEWTASWDSDTKTPYAQNNEKWISYDDARSIAEKVKFAVREGLGGVMVWSIDTDDFNGDCGIFTGISHTYPLVNKINQVMVSAISGNTDDDHYNNNDYNHNDVFVYDTNSSKSSSTHVSKVYIFTFIFFTIFYYF